MKERNFIIKITNFETGYIMTSGESLRSSGTESRVQANDLLVCKDVLDTRDSQLQKLTYLRPQKPVR